jgi:V/A-type H+-transporting ATPase subunit B
MANNRTGISPILVGYSEILAIVGDIVRVKVPEEENGNGASSRLGLEDLAVLEAVDGSLSLAQVIGIKRDVVALQVFGGTRGISTDSTVRFLGHPMQASYSGNIFGRVFRGTGEPIDGGPDLSNGPKVTIGGPSVNPMRRVLASKMIRTDVPMIDVFNCLVESQKIPIFSVSGEPFNQLLARIGIQADADVIVFGGMGLIFDDYYFFRKAFEEAGMFTRTVMFVNQASEFTIILCALPACSKT